MKFKKYLAIWKKWNLVNKLCAIGVVATIIGVLISIIPLSSELYKKPSIPNINIQMRIHYFGFFRIRVINIGQIIAKDCVFKIETWQFGAPGEDLWKSEKFPDLIPGNDWFFDIDIFKARDPIHEGKNARNNDICGYISISCIGFIRPKAWTFLIPKEGEDKGFNLDNIELIPFNYGLDEPRNIASKIWYQKKGLQY